MTMKLKEMKKNKLHKAEDLISKRYGEKGTASREKFKEQAFSNYFAEIIRERRKQLNLTQEDLAKKVGKKRPYISRIEKGEDIRISNFALIASALDLSIQISIN